MEHEHFLLNGPFLMPTDLLKRLPCANASVTVAIEKMEELSKWQ